MTATLAADCGLRGLALLDAVIDHIERHPETWFQGEYRCRSGMCVAGHAAVIAGGQWLYPDRPDGLDAPFLVPEEEDDGKVLHLPNGTAGVTARCRAKRLLLISSETASALFCADNSLDTIRRIRDEIAAGERS